MEPRQHGGLGISPLLVGLLGVLAGALIVAIVHCVIIFWCKDSQPANASLPVNRRRENVGGRDYRREQAAGSSSSGSLSNVQLVIASTNYSGGGGDKGKDEICAVCLSEFEQGDEVRVLPGCAHIFHAYCIDKWLHSHRNCPLCRADTVPPSPRGDLVCSLPANVPSASPLPQPEFGALGNGPFIF